MPWDILDEDCSDITDWTDGDVGDAVSSVNPAGQFEFDSNTGYALRIRDIGSFPNTFTYEIKLYCDLVGAYANDDYFNINCRQADERLHVAFCSDGLFINDTDSGWTEVGTNLVKTSGSAEWQTWRFLVTFGTVGEGVCDVYLNDSTHSWEKVGTAIPCSTVAAFTEGETTLVLYTTTTNYLITHVDYVKIATGLTTPTVAGIMTTNTGYWGSV